MIDYARKEATIDCVRKAARPFVAMNPRSIVHVCRTRMCTIDRGFVVANAHGLVVNLRRLRVDPRFAQQILGSEVCVRDTRIIVQKLRS